MNLLILLAVSLSTSQSAPNPVPAEQHVPVSSTWEYIRPGVKMLAPPEGLEGWFVQVADDHVDGADPDSMAALLPARGSIPGFVDDTEYGGAHTHIMSLKVEKSAHHDDATCNRMFRGADETGTRLKLRTFPRVKVYIWVFQTEDEAKKYVAYLTNDNPNGQITDAGKYMVHGVRLLHSTPVGDDYWVEVPPLNLQLGGRRGRVVYEVRATRVKGIEPVDLDESVARDIDYRILQNPSLSMNHQARAGVSLNGVGIAATMLNGVAMVRLTDFVKTGAKVNFAPEEGVPSGVINYHGKSMVIKPLAPSAKMDGTAVGLDIPAFIFDQDIIVPFNSVVAALGMN